MLVFLSCQQTLLLHGNLISSLAVIKEHLPSTVCTLSLADNEISDLNEVHIWGYFSYFTTSLCNDRRQFFLLIIIMLIQFVGLFFANKMLTTSLGQVVGKKITTSLYSSVADPVLQIRGGLWGGHPGPEIRVGGGLKKFFLV